MKKFYRSLYALLAASSIAVLSSCVSIMYGKKAAAMNKDLPSDVSEYCDYHLKQCKFPDGKIADVYVFNDVSEGVYWQMVQESAFDSDWRKKTKDYIADLEARKQEADPNTILGRKSIADYDNYIANANLRLNVRGPLTPYGQVNSTYSKEELSKMKTIISYYNAEDLGELASYMTENSAAQACFEDADGVYLLTICPPKNLKQLQNNKAEQKRHKGEFGYEVAYLPRKAYPDITPPKLTPAKVTPITPSSLPDSDRDLNPVSPTGSGAYYYDEDLTYQLQWLAVKIACKGVYDMAYTGDFRAKNPTDYYKTSFIKQYLVQESESIKQRGSRTDTFEGICFDYADFAYQELRDNRNEYSSRITGFWMVGTFSDPNDITVYKIAEKGETSNDTINQTPVVVYNQHNHNHVYAHGNATCHAWFWVETVDGVIYWVDPTWTDNSGRPVYGIVRGGQEVQLEPDSRFFAR